MGDTPNHGIPRSLENNAREHQQKPSQGNNQHVTFSKKEMKMKNEINQISTSQNNQLFQEPKHFRKVF